MSSNTPQSKAQRREAARAQALEIKKKQEAADKRSRLITLTILGIVLAALVGIVVWLFVRDHQANAANQVEDIPLSEVANVPATAREDGGILISQGGVAGGTENADVPTVAVYFDYMCPACGQFEQVNLDALEGFIEDGTANVVFHPVSILDRMAQGTQFSTRAASAMAWVADRAPEQALAFHIVMFENEPEENTSGHTDEQIADLAKQAGVPADVADGIASGEARRTFAQWVFSATELTTSNPDLQGDRGFGTPTITLDGVRWGGNWSVAGTLEQAVADATK